MGLGRQTGALLVAIRRDGRLFDRLAADEELREGDIAYLVGAGDALARPRACCRTESSHVPAA